MEMITRCTILLVVIKVVWSTTDVNHPCADCPCAQPKTVGMCRMAQKQFFYNTGTGACELFLYGGCGGNDNRFDSEEECKKHCMRDEPCKSCAHCVCSQAKVSGMCMAYFPSYYYDTATGKCEKFVYGGCQGNWNRFPTAEDCAAKCY